MAKLTFILEDGQEVVVPLTERLTVGRGEENDVVIDDERISAHHAELLLNADGSVQVFDLKSAAGTTVNDVSVVSHTLLHGDHLAFGPLRAVLDLENAANAPASQATSNIALSKPAVEVPPAPQPLPTQAIRAAENRLALLEAATKQAESAHRDWLAAIQVLTLKHDEKTASLEVLRADTTTAQTALDKLTATTATTATAQQEINAQQQEATARLQQLQESTAQEDTRLTEARRLLAEIQASTQQSQTLLNTQQEQSRAAQEQLTSLQAQTTELAATQEKLTQARTDCLAVQSQHTALTATLATLQQQHAQELQQHTLALQQSQAQLTTAQTDLSTCRSDLAAESRLLDAARTQRAALDAANAAPLDSLHHDIDTARSQLAQLTARLMPLRDWKEAQDQRVAQLATLPPGSPEARELHREIEAEAADLHRIITTPPSRTPRIIHIEHPHFTGVPMKSETTRIKDGSDS